MKALAYEFAGKVLPARAPHVEVFDALRLHDMCNLTRPTEASNADGRRYSEKQKTTLDEKSIFVDGTGEESAWFGKRFFLPNAGLYCTPNAANSTLAAGSGFT